VGKRHAPLYFDAAITSCPSLASEPEMASLLAISYVLVCLHFRLAVAEEIWWLGSHVHRCESEMTCDPTMLEREMTCDPTLLEREMPCEREMICACTTQCTTQCVYAPVKSISIPYFCFAFEIKSWYIR
jgi:hypothetical protein